MDLTQEVLLPSVEYRGKNGVQKRTKEVVSKAFYQETDKHISFSRNLRFCLYKFYLDKVENKASFRIFDTKNKWVATLIIEKERVIYAEKGNKFVNGNAALFNFQQKLDKYGFTSKDLNGVVGILCKEEYQCLKKNQLFHHFVRLTLHHFKYKSLTNVYFKFWNYDATIAGFNSKSLVYKKLRKCRGLHDATKVIFGKNKKEYRVVLLDFGCLLTYETAYYLVHRFKLTPEQVIKLYQEKGFHNFALSYNDRQFINKTLKCYDLKNLQKHILSGGSKGVILDCMRMIIKLSTPVIDYISAQKLDINLEHNLLIYLTKDLKGLTNYQLPYYEEFDKLPKRDEYRYEFARTSNDLRRWGQELNICIGSYDADIITGLSYCFSIVLQNGERYCIEVVDDYKRLDSTFICQAKGYRNRDLQTIHPELYEQLSTDLKENIKYISKRHEFKLVVEPGTEKENDVDMIQKAHNWLKENV